MEVVLLRSDSRQESVGDVSSGSSVGFEGLEGGKSLSGDHGRDSTTFERLLTENGRNHRRVGGGSLGSRDGHHLHVVVREGLDELVRDTEGVDLGGGPSESSLHDVVESSHETIVSKDLLESDLEVELDFWVVGIRVLSESDVADGDLLSLGVDGLEHLSSLSFSCLGEEEIVHSTGEGSRLEVLGEASTEDREEFPSRLGTVDLEAGVDESVRRRSELSLVEDSDEEFSVHEEHLSLLRVRSPELVLDLVLGDEVESGSSFGDDVEEKC